MSKRKYRGRHKTEAETILNKAIGKKINIRIIILMPKLSLLNLVVKFWKKNRKDYLWVHN